MEWGVRDRRERHDPRQTRQANGDSNGGGCGKESDEREADVVVPTVIHALRALYTHNIRLSLGSFHRPVPPLHRPVPIPPRYPNIKEN